MESGLHAVCTLLSEAAGKGASEKVVWRVQSVIYIVKDWFDRCGRVGTVAKWASEQACAIVIVKHVGILDEYQSGSRCRLHILKTPW